MFTFHAGFSAGMRGTGKRVSSGRALGLEHFRLAQIKSWYRDSHLTILGYFIVMSVVHLLFGGAFSVLWSTALLVFLVSLALIVHNPRSLPLFHDATTSQVSASVGGFWEDMNTWSLWSDRRTGLDGPEFAQGSLSHTLSRILTRRAVGDLLMYVANWFLLMTMLVVTYPFMPLARPGMPFFCF